MLLVRLPPRRRKFTGSNSASNLSDFSLMKYGHNNSNLRFKHLMKKKVQASKCQRYIIKINNTAAVVIFLAEPPLMVAVVVCISTRSLNEIGRGSKQ